MMCSWEEQVLAGIADFVMANGGRVPLDMPDGCTSIRAEVWPEYPAQPTEIRFTATWPDITLICRRSLNGYSLDGGLHRI